MKLVKARVPLSEMFNYVSTLRGMSKGRAQYTMQVGAGAAAAVVVLLCWLMFVFWGGCAGWAVWAGRPAASPAAAALQPCSAASL